MIKKKIKYLILAFILLLIPNLKVSASTYYSNEFTAQLYDNYGTSLSPVSTSLTNNRYQGIIPSMSANTSGGAWGVSSPITLLDNHTYTITLTIDGTFGGNIILSTYNRIGVGTSLQNAVNSYVNNLYAEEKYSRSLDDGMTLQFAFTSNINSSYIVIPFATSSTGDNWTFSISSVIIEDLGIDSVTQDQINSSLNNQTNIINNSINNLQSNLNDTITEQNENTQNSIANNNGASSAITDGLNSCGWQYKYTLEKGKRFDSNGNLIDDSNSYYTSNYYSIERGDTFTFKGFGVQATGNIIFYDSNYNYLDYWGVRDRTFDIKSLSNVAYFRISTTVPSGLMYEGECVNKIDVTNDKLDDLNSSITSGDIDNNSGKSFFDSFSSSDHGGISGIITAPLVAIKKMLDKNCSPLTTTYKGKEISLPCGYEFWAKMPAIKEFINLTLGGLLCYNIIRKLYHLIENMKNPDDDRVEVMKL